MYFYVLVFTSGLQCSVV